MSRHTVYNHEDGSKVVIETEHVDMWNMVCVKINGDIIRGHRAGTKACPDKIRYDLTLISLTLQAMGFTKEMV